MPPALSVDLHERVIEAIEAGSLRREGAKRFGLGTASAVRWHERFREESELAPKPSGGDRALPALEAHAERTLEICRAHPQISLRKLRDALATARCYSSASALA